MKTIGILGGQNRLPMRRFFKELLAKCGNRAYKNVALARMELRPFILR